MQFKASLIAFAAFFAVSNASAINLEARQRQTGTVRACTDPNFGGYCEDIVISAHGCANLSPALVAGGIESASLTAPDYFYCLFNTATGCPVESQIGTGLIPSFPYNVLPDNTLNNVASISCSCTNAGPC